MTHKKPTQTAQDENSAHGKRSYPEIPPYPKMDKDAVEPARTTKRSNVESDLELELESKLGNYIKKVTRNNEVRDTLGSVVRPVKNKFQRFFSRVGFHALSFGGAVLASLLTPFTSSFAQLLSSSQSVAVYVGGFTYLGVLLLFPAQSNRTATAMGLVVALASIFTGYWPLGIALGGIVTFIINAINRRKIKFGSCVTLLLLAIGLGGMSGQSITALLPLWFGLLLGGVTALGLIFPEKIARLADKVLGKVGRLTHRTIPQWDGQYSKGEKAKEDSRLVKEKQDEKIATQSILADDEFGFGASVYLKMLGDITQYKKNLPADMLASIQAIENKTQAILKCMKDDPNDVVAGKRFLNRYLPMIDTSVERFVRLSQHNANSAEFEEVRSLTQQALRDMSHAFQQMHQRLLENNVDDLMVNLKVMDRLLKSEGYDALERTSKQKE